MQFQFEDCVLDTERRELRRADHLVSLEPQVFDLLEYVIRQRDRVVSKDDLIAAIWNGRIISDSALGTRINAVRSVIGDSGKEQRLIRTLPRKGIRFVGPVVEAIQTSQPSASARLATMLDHHPVFAVLPFSNLSNDPEQEYFADGISEDLIAAISSWCRFPVIARNSSFIYKDRAVDVKQVGRELGARYLLEGSVRKSGSRMRITAQLVDTTTGYHLWADRYDREIGDLFAVQDEITASIAAAIEPEFLEAEERRASGNGTGSLTAYDLVQRAHWYLNKYTFADLMEAQRLFTAAVNADPTCAPAYAGVAISKFWFAQMSWGHDFSGTIESAQEFACKAIALDDKYPRGQMYFGQITLWMRQYDNAITAIRRASELNPSLAQAYTILAYALDCVGNFQEALATVEHSLRLRPHDRTLARCLPSLAFAHYQLGDYRAAEGIARRAMSISPAFWTGHQILAASLGQLDRKDEATREVAELQRKYPGTSRAAFSRRLPFRDSVHVEHIEDGLMKAGWNG
jgi:TolB-like protein/Flp pilus assembly protein TadD